MGQDRLSKPFPHTPAQLPILDANAPTSESRPESSADVAERRTKMLVEISLGGGMPSDLQFSILHGLIVAARLAWQEERKNGAFTEKLQSPF